MHPRVGWWTDQSIEWFVRASEDSSYHRNLSDRIAELLFPCRSVLELGCGLGYEAELLQKKGFVVTALDSNEDVIRLARKRSGLDIFHCEDANQTNGIADALLCINYGHLCDIAELSDLLSHASMRLIYVLSRHNGHGTDTREDRTETVRKLMKESSFDFSESSLSLDFDQPLKSQEEAKAFIDFTYLGKNAQSYLAFVEKTENPKYPFVLRNRKELSIFVLNKRR
ncbi:MAG: class I SAM-dependent methyltransferase [Spirochaetales bacterium]